MWWENNVFIATIALTVIAITAIFRLGEGAEKIALSIVTGIAAFVTGYVTRGIKDGVTTLKTTSEEETTNVPAVPVAPPKTK